MLHFKTKTKKIIDLIKLILIIIFVILTSLLILKVRKENVYSGTTKINDFIPDLNYKIFSNQQSSNDSNENSNDNTILNDDNFKDNKSNRNDNARLGNCASRFSIKKSRCKSKSKRIFDCCRWSNYNICKRDFRLNYRWII